jgi:hypothetical protein
MASTRLRVPLFAHIYTWLFLLVLSVWPLAVPALLSRHSAVPSSTWATALAAIALIQIAFWYAQLRCSNQSLSYWNGLLVVAASMSTGWAQMSLIIVLPSLLVVFVASIVLTLYSEIRGAPQEAPLRFQRLLRWFYGNRMRQ